MANLEVSQFGFEAKCPYCNETVFSTAKYPTDGSADYDALHEEADEALDSHECQ